MWLNRSRIAPAGGVRPPTQIARRARRRFRSGTCTARRRPTARSSATASLLITAGPAPAKTAARTAAADDNSSAGLACAKSSPRALRNAAVSESRVPDPGSRATSGVRPSSEALTPFDRRTHLWSAGTTTISSSYATTRLRNPDSAPGLSMNPRSAAPSRTADIACSLLVVVRMTSGGLRPLRAAVACSDTSQRGISCSATVRLAATFNLLRLSVRSEASPASTCWATSSNLFAHGATTTPGGVSWVPRTVRTASRTPVWASIEVSRADTACCVSPSSRPAAPRLAVLATARKTSSADSSGMRELSAMVYPTTSSLCDPPRTSRIPTWRCEAQHQKYDPPSHRRARLPLYPRQRADLSRLAAHSARTAGSDGCPAPIRSRTSGPRDAVHLVNGAGNTGHCDNWGWPVAVAPGRSSDPVRRAVTAQSHTSIAGEQPRGARPCRFSFGSSQRGDRMNDDRNRSRGFGQLRRRARRQLTRATDDRCDG